MPDQPLTVLQLLRERRGEVVYHAPTGLSAKAQRGDKPALAALIQYADKGALDFRRSDAVSLLVDVVKKPHGIGRWKFKRKAASFHEFLDWVVSSQR